MKLNFFIKLHSIVPFPRIEIRLMLKSAYGIFFSERRKYLIADFMESRLDDYCRLMILFYFANHYRLVKYYIETNYYI
jgi:hypothetical protein